MFLRCGCTLCVAVILCVYINPDYDCDGVQGGSGSHMGAAAALIRSLAHPTVPPTWQQDIDTESHIPRSSPLCYSVNVVYLIWISCDHDHQGFFFFCSLKIDAFVGPSFFIHISRHSLLLCINERSTVAAHCIVRSARLHESTHLLTCDFRLPRGGWECWPWRGFLSLSKMPDPLHDSPSYEWTHPWAEC